MIWVYNFAATSSDVPSDSAWSGQFSEQTQTPEQIAEGRKVGAEIATELVEQIQKMGMPAAEAVQGTIPQVNDLEIRGYLVSVEQGSAAKRIVVGFGSGASDLEVAVEGYQVTPQGLRELGTGDVSAESGKSPGGALGRAGLANFYILLRLTLHRSVLLLSLLLAFKERREQFEGELHSILHEPKQSRISRREGERIDLRVLQITRNPYRNREQGIAEQTPDQRYVLHDTV
jgi:hypothetical protein